MSVPSLELSIFIIQAHRYSISLQAPLTLSSTFSEHVSSDRQSLKYFVLLNKVFGFTGADCWTLDSPLKFDETKDPFCPDMEAFFVTFDKLRGSMILFNKKPEGGSLYLLFSMFSPR